MAQTFLNCEKTCDWTDASASMYDRKAAARSFDIIHDILRSHSLVKSLLKGQNAPIWRQRAPMHMDLSGTDGLKSDHMFNKKLTAQYQRCRGERDFLWIPFTNPQILKRRTLDISYDRKLDLLMDIRRSLRLKKVSKF